MLEQEYDFASIASLDAQLHFQRFAGLWDYDEGIPVQLQSEMLTRRPASQQRCLVCGNSGHHIMTCPSVTGRTASGPKRPKPTGQKGICWAFKRTGKCPRGEKCPFRHEKG